MYRILTSSCAPLKTLWVSCKGSKGTQNRNAGARGTQKKCCAGTWEHGTRKQNRGTGGTRDAKAHRTARPSLGYRYITVPDGVDFHHCGMAEERLVEGLLQAENPGPQIIQIEEILAEE